MADKIANVGALQSAKLKMHMQKYRSKWENDSELKDWLLPIEGNDLRAFCVFCNVSVLARLSCLRAHAKAEKHIHLASCFHSNENAEQAPVDLSLPETVNEELPVKIQNKKPAKTVVPKQKQPQTKVQAKKVRVEVVPEQVRIIWQIVFVEIHGPFECTPSGNRYVISATDRVTNWIEATALSDCDGKLIAEFLVTVYARMGFCKYLFINCPSELSPAISEELKIQTKGIVPDSGPWDRLLRFISSNDKSMILPENKRKPTKAKGVLKERIVFEGPEWDRHLSRILFELRTNPIAEEGNKTPFSMMYNRGHRGVLAKKKDKRKTGRPKKIVSRAEVVPKALQVVKAVQKRYSTQRLQTKSHQYGLRTTLKAKGKSTVISRMLQKSRLKRSLGLLDDTSEKDLKAGKAKVKGTVGDADIPKQKVTQDASNKDQETNKPDEILPDSPMEGHDADVSTAAKESAIAVFDMPNEDEEFLYQDDECCEEDLIEEDDFDDEDGDDDSEIYDESDLYLYGGSKKKARKERMKLDLLTEAQKQEIEGVDPAMCSQCGVGFFSEVELEMHSKFHKEDSSSVFCVHCEKEETEWSQMQLHLTTHSEASVALILPLECLTCRECSKVVSSIDNVEKHLQVFHRRRLAVICKTCGLQSRTHRRYLAHAGAHSDTQYECFRCKPKFQTRSFYAFAEHHVIHEGTGIPCPNCSRVFPSEFHVNEHQKHHKKMEHVNICEFCGKQFFGVSAIRHHLRYFHYDSEAFACTQCTYVGRTKSNLRGHMDRIHNKPFKCPNCDYACLTEKSMMKHVDMYHNAENRLFPCAHCPYRGRDVKTLAEHTRIRHRVSSGFCCPTCQTIFKTRTLLRDHMPTHTGARAYECKLCPYTAKYRPTMYRHVLNKHPGETLSSASSVAGRERRRRGPNVAGNTIGPKKRAKSKSTLEEQGVDDDVDDVKVETENLRQIEASYAFNDGEQEGELILHTAVDDEDDDGEHSSENQNAVTNIPDSNNMVAIMDANLLAEMAASGQVCVQYIDDAGSIETIEVRNDGIQLDSETSKAVKEKFQMLTQGLTFSCL